MDVIGIEIDYGHANIANTWHFTWGAKTQSMDCVGGQARLPVPLLFAAHTYQLQYNTYAYYNTDSN